MSERISAIFAGVLALALFAGGWAVAQETHEPAPMTPGTSSEDSAEVQAEIDTWVAEAHTFQQTTQSLAAMWRDGTSDLLDQTSAAYVEAGRHFVEFTHERSGAIRELSPDNDAACILRGIGLDVTDRLDAYEAAEGADAHVEVLTGIERLVYEGFLIFQDAEPSEDDHAARGSADDNGTIVILAAMDAKQAVRGQKQATQPGEGLPCGAE